MTIVKMDDQISQFEATDEKVGDFVQNLISNMPAGRIVTEVTLDGLPFGGGEEGPDAISKSLQGVRELQIRTADKAIWAATGLDIAISCVDRVRHSLIRAAELFRDTDTGRANQFFVHCLEGLERFLESMTITRCAMNLDFSKIQTENGNLLQLEDSLLGILKAIMENQERHEYEAVAETVEYELLTNLSTWTSTLRNLRSSSAASA